MHAASFGGKLTNWASLSIGGERWYRDDVYRTANLHTGGRRLWTVFVFHGRASFKALALWSPRSVARCRARRRTCAGSPSRRPLGSRADRVFCQGAQLNSFSRRVPPDRPCMIQGMIGIQWFSASHHQLYSTVPTAEIIVRTQRVSSLRAKPNKTTLVVGGPSWRRWQTVWASTL